MSQHAGDYEGLLRRALRSAVDSVEPSADGLDRIRARLTRPRPLAVAWATAVCSAVARRASGGLHSASVWLQSARLWPVAAPDGQRLAWVRTAAAVAAVTVIMAMSVSTLTPLGRQMLSQAGTLLHSIGGGTPPGPGVPGTAGQGNGLPDGTGAAPGGQSRGQLPAGCASQTPALAGSSAGPVASQGASSAAPNASPSPAASPSASSPATTPAPSASPGASTPATAGASSSSASLAMPRLATPVLGSSASTACQSPAAIPSPTASPSEGPRQSTPSPSPSLSGPGQASLGPSAPPSPSSPAPSPSSSSPSASPSSQGADSPGPTPSPDASSPGSASPSPGAPSPGTSSSSPVSSGSGAPAAGR
jgi:hypothetical protein